MTLGLRTITLGLVPETMDLAFWGLQAIDSCFITLYLWF